MKTFLECLPCLVRQTFEAVNFATDDEIVKEQIMRACLDELSTIAFDKSPPYMAAVIHRIIRDKTGCNDPYLAIREQSNKAALKLYDKMKEIVNNSSNRLETAIRLSIIGNVIDFGAPSRPELDQLPQIINEMSSRDLKGGYVDELISKAKNVQKILILADNAGEIVFDRVLIEELGPWRCTYAVKGSPIINDSVYSDALQTGLTKIVNVIDNGADAPGTVLDWCSDKFVEKFNSAEIIISKGQGNFETLSETPRQDIFFLLKAKCPLIATHLDCEMGDYVVTSTNANTIVQSC